MNEEDEPDVVVDYEGNSSDEEGPIPLPPDNGRNDIIIDATNKEPQNADETHPQGESITLSSDNKRNVVLQNQEKDGMKSNKTRMEEKGEDDDDEEEGMVNEESNTNEEMKKNKIHNNNNPVTSPKSPLDGELKSARTPSSQRSDHYNNNNSNNTSMRLKSQNQSRGYYDEHKNRARESPSFKRPRYSPREYDRRRTAARPSNRDREEIGIYIPPAKRKLLQQQREERKKEGDEVESNHTQQRQRILWQELKKSIHAVLNRLNSKTIKPLIHQLFTNCNLIRGRGILAKSLLRAASTSPTYIHVYAALVAVLNTKLPEIGELILHRTIHAFQRSYARRDKSHALAMVLMIGHLFNQGVCFELLILQILTVLLERPTDDSIEVALVLIRTTGQSLLESTPAGLHAVMEQLRHLLHDGGDINKRIQYQVQEFLQLRKQNLEGLPPPIIPELDLVERDEQITLECGLDDDDDDGEEEEDKLQTHLDVFHYDANWDENENEWKNIQKEILGGGDDDSDEDDDGSGESSTDDGDGSSNDEDSSSDEEDTELTPDNQKTNTDDQKQMQVIQDLSEADLIHLRRTIYLTIMSSATFEECTHKLTKVDIPPGSEMELINMIIECCSQERTFLRYYGLISGRFCLLHERWRLAFEQSFEQQYNTIHRLETNKLRNVAKMFAHLLHTDSMSWSCLHIIHLNEDETTSSSRIFIKIVVQELAENMGMGKLCGRFLLNEEENDNVAAENKMNNKHIEDQRLWFQGMFPKDVPRNTRYAINFFTSIGLGPLTDSLREHLKNAPKMILAQAAAKSTALTVRSNSSSSDSDSRSSSSGSSSSYSSTSSSSYSSSSSSGSSSYTSDSYSSSSDSYSRRRGSRRRSSSDKRNHKNRRRYSSSESDSDSSSIDRSTSKKIDKKDRSSRRRGSRRDRRSRSVSPPRQVIMKTEVEEKSGRNGNSIDDKRNESKTKDTSSSKSSRERSSSKGKSESKRDIRRSSEKDPSSEEKKSSSKQITKNNEAKKHVSRSTSRDRSKSSKSRSDQDRGRKGNEKVNGRGRESQSNHRSRNDRHYSSDSENSDSDISSEQDSYGRRKRPSRKSSKFRDRSRSRSIERSSKPHSTKRDNLDKPSSNKGYDSSKNKSNEDSPRKSDKKSSNNENLKETKTSGKRNRSSSFSSGSEQRSNRREKKRSYERERSSSRRNRRRFRSHSRSDSSVSQRSSRS